MEYASSCPVELIFLWGRVGSSVKPAGGFDKERSLVSERFVEGLVAQSNHSSVRAASVQSFVRGKYCRYRKCQGRQGSRRVFKGVRPSSVVDRVIVGNPWSIIIRIVAGVSSVIPWGIRHSWGIVRRSRLIAPSPRDISSIVEILIRLSDVLILINQSQPITCVGPVTKTALRRKR